MYKIIALLVFPLFFLSSSQAQQFHWAQEVEDSHYFYDSYCADISYDANQNCSYVIGGMQHNFIRKVSATGAVLWHHKFQTSTTANAVTHDHQGNVYIVGTFVATTDLNLDPDPNAVFMLNSPVASGGGDPRDIFVLKMNAAGQFVWGAMIAQRWECTGTAIAVDDNQNVYVAGVLANTNFVQKIDAQGNLLWKHDLGTCSSSTTFGIIYNPKQLAIQGNHLYISGDYRGTADMDPSPNRVYSLQAMEGADNFLVKLQLDGSFVWAQSLGFPYDEYSSALTVDDQGYIYEAGVYHEQDSSFYHSGASFVFKKGPYAYLRKLSPQGTPLLFFSSKREKQELVDIDASQPNYLYATGSMLGAVNKDILIQKIHSNNLRLAWEQMIPSSYIGEGRGVATTPSGEVYVVGRYEGIVDFNWGTATHYLRATGRHEGFMLQLGAATIGIPYLQTLEGVQLYPNPAQATVRIESQEWLTEGSLELYSIQGQLLGQFPMEGAHYDLNISSYPAGTYWVRISNGAKTATLQLIKSN